MKKCTYCGVYATSNDHFVPYSYNSSSKKRVKSVQLQKENIYPSCKQCNSIASNKHFCTVKEKREYIQGVLRKKYKKLLKLPDWSQEELKEISYSLRSGIELRMMAKRWIVNRVNFPEIIYNEEPIRKELQDLLALF